MDTLKKDKIVLLQKVVKKCKEKHTTHNSNSSAKDRHIAKKVNILIKKFNLLKNKNLNIES